MWKLCKPWLVLDFNQSKIGPFSFSEANITYAKLTSVSLKFCMKSRHLHIHTAQTETPCWACENTFCAYASVLLALQYRLSPLAEAMPCVSHCGKQTLQKMSPCRPLKTLKVSTCVKNVPIYSAKKKLTLESFPSSLCWDGRGKGPDKQLCSWESSDSPPRRWHRSGSTAGSAKPPGSRLTSAWWLPAPPAASAPWGRLWKCKNIQQG